MISTLPKSLPATPVPDPIQTQDLHKKAARQAYFTWLNETLKWHDESCPYIQRNELRRLAPINVLYPVHMEGIAMMPIVETIRSVTDKHCWYYLKVPGKWYYQGNLKDQENPPSNNQYMARLNINDIDYIVYRHGHDTGQNYWLINLTTYEKHQIPNLPILKLILDILKQGVKAAPLYINHKNKCVQKIVKKLLSATH